MGYEGDHPAEPKQPGNQLKQSHHDGQGQGQIDVERCGWWCQLDQGGEHDGRNCRGRPRYHDHGRAPQGGDDRCDHGGEEPIFRGQTGDDGKGNTLRQHDGGVGQPCNRIAFQAGSVDLGIPRAPQGQSVEWKQPWIHCLVLVSEQNSKRFRLHQDAPLPLASSVSYSYSLSSILASQEEWPDFIQPSVWSVGAVPGLYSAPSGVFQPSLSAVSKMKS